MSFWGSFATALAGSSGQSGSSDNNQLPGDQNQNQNPLESGAKKGPSPAIRYDVYRAMQACELWLGMPGAPGDGASYRTIYNIVLLHFPKLKLPTPLDEVSAMVGAVTNLCFELAKLDGLASVLAMQ